MSVMLMKVVSDLEDLPNGVATLGDLYENGEYAAPKAVDTLELVLAVFGKGHEASVYYSWLNQSLGNCSDEGWVMPRYEVPGSPGVTSTKVTAYKDKSGQFVPILNLTWSQLPDETIFSLNGTEMRVVEMATNNSVCVRYIFLNKLKKTNPKHGMWTFSLDRVVVNTNFKYQVFVTNLPKPDIGSYTIITTITVPETLSIDSFTCPKSKVEWNPNQERKKVLIIYSLDHPLYKEIILKLCAFLRAKCATDVTLDLLDSAWLSTIGRIQWLDMQRERISKTSDKAMILCSPGVYAKWKAMCGGPRVRLKEDERSPIGDMLTPALSLIIPDFVQASSFEKYIVAYFDDVCCEDDVPAPFNAVVKYKLMKHFEELYFRILDMEKHEPGQIKCIKGIGENDYFNCPSGKALWNAIETFQNYQLKNPNWFEMELLGKDDQEEATSFKSIFPTDMNCNPVTECDQFIEEHKSQTLINMIKCQSKDEHVFMSSVEETGMLLNEYSSVVTTDVQYSSPKLNSLVI
ncbi:interleukin-17 receptor A [Xyrauchen texanus]|uniref:interleukin-17 receptor A n=1 Tax=Xyrauchen texanus TaxID=154827 RepID=UPI0022421716|nr:interleukin-17 receptor A [Xyrauchen texanus]